jgi:hypothetical protein
MTGKGKCTAKVNTKCPKKTLECDTYPAAEVVDCGDWSECVANKPCLKTISHSPCNKYNQYIWRARK